MDFPSPGLGHVGLPPLPTLPMLHPSPAVAAAAAAAAAAAHTNMFGLYSPQPGLTSKPPLGPGSLPPLPTVSSVPSLASVAPPLSSISAPTITSNSSKHRPPPVASAPPPSIASTGSSRTSSFAAALRNLAKNASVSSELPPPPVPSMSPKKSATVPGSSPPTMGEPTSLLDVRRGFDKPLNCSSESLMSRSSPFLTPSRPLLHTEPSTMTTSTASSPRTSATELSSGFQPYRPSMDSCHRLSPASAVSPFSMSQAQAAVAAASYGYHPALFGSPHVPSPYGLDADPLYRVQLERYTAGLVRSPLIPHYPSMLGAYSSELLRQSSLGLVPPPPPPPPPSTCPPSSSTSLAMTPTIPTSSNDRTEEIKKRDKEKADKDREKDKDRKRRRSSRDHHHQHQQQHHHVPPPVTANGISGPPPPKWEGLTATTYNPLGVVSSHVDNTALLRPPPSLTSLPDIRLPTKPLDISEMGSCVKTMTQPPPKLTGVATTLQPPPPPPPPPHKPQLSSSNILPPINSSSSNTSSNACSKTNNTVSLLRGIRAKGTNNPTTKSEEKSSAPGSQKKMLFVRPFEDDYHQKSTVHNHSSRNHNHNNNLPISQIFHVPDNYEVKKAKVDEKEEKLQIYHHKNEEHNVAYTNNNNIISTKQLNSKMLKPAPKSKLDVEAERRLQGQDDSDYESMSSDSSSKKDLAAAAAAAAAAAQQPPQPYQEPVTREKLRYLRYFRLVTHRKRNDVEIEKLEKRKARYQERSPSPAPSGSLSCEPRPPSPTLSLPSVAPHLNRFPESNAKMMYMSAIGLWRVTDEDKQEREEMWDVILDDRIARGSMSTSVSYFVKLNETFKSNTSRANRKRRWADAFISPTMHLHEESSSPSKQVQSHLQGLSNMSAVHQQPLQQISSSNSDLLTCLTSTSPMSNSVSSGPASPASATSSNCKLPINLSTLLPVSKNSLQDLATDTMPEMIKSSVNLNGILQNGITLPPLQPMPVLAAKDKSKKSRIQTPPSHFHWPGVEAVIESYRKYSQDCVEEANGLREKCQQYQLDLSNKRSQVDALSTQMSSLARHQTMLNTKSGELSEKLHAISDTLRAIKNM